VAGAGDILVGAGSASGSTTHFATNRIERFGEFVTKQIDITAENDTTCEAARRRFRGEMLRAFGSTVIPITRKKGGTDMNSIIYVVGLVVVVLFVAGFLGLR